MAHYIRNCFWLMVPSILLLFIAADRLPPAFQAEVFWNDIPWFIAWPENLFRTAVFALPAFMPLSIETTQQRRGLALYLFGTGVYFASWLALIIAPQSWWSLSAAGFLAPAYTPLIWLFGIGLIGERLFVSRIGFRPWMFFALTVVFLGFHIVHTALVFGRLS